MRAWVVAWFCECGSIVRMSFCAAQRSSTCACAAPATSASASISVLIISSSSVLLERQALLHQRGEIAGAQWNHLVVEIVIRIVQHAPARPRDVTRALPEEGVGAGPLLQEVGKVLAAHRRLVLRDDVPGAEQALRHVGGETRLARAV